MRKSDHFYLAIFEKKKLWYNCGTRNSVSVNKLGSFMVKKMALEAELGKKYANEEA